MNKENPYREQADKHRKRIAKPQPDPNNVSTMPPRSRVHHAKKKKTVLKFKYPVIRLLVLFFILLPVSVISVISSLEDSAVETGRSGFEKVSLEERQNAEPDTVYIENQESPNVPQKNESSVTESFQDKEPSTTSVGKPESEGKDKQINQPVASKQKSDTPAKSSSTDNNEQNENAETETTKPAAVEKYLYHTVKPGETLFRIAMTYYKDQTGIEKIRVANHIIGNEIEAGQILKIPVN